MKLLSLLTAMLSGCAELARASQAHQRRRGVVKRQNKALLSVPFLCAAGLLALACSPAAAQAPSRPVLYYYLVPGVGYVPVYAAAAAPTASAPAQRTYGSSAPRTGQPSYYTEDYPGAENEPPDQKLPAHIRVRLPANAEVTINGTKTTSTGPVREYETPELNPDRVYTYLVKAKWLEGGITVEKSVRVRALAGNRVTVNFVPPAQERPRPRPVVRVTEREAAELPPPPGPPPSSLWQAPYP